MFLLSFKVLVLPVKDDSGDGGYSYEGTRLVKDCIFFERAVERLQWHLNESLAPDYRIAPKTLKVDNLTI